MNNKVLIGLLFAMIAFYLLSNVIGSKKESSFDPVVIHVDTALVDELILNIKDQSEALTVTKGENGWNLSQGSKVAEADTRRINGLIQSVIEVKALRYAAKKKDKWAEFEVSENATRVKINGGDKVLADFYVGRFSFNQQTKSGISFIRLADSDEVYAIEGFLSLSFNGDIDAFRDSKLWDWKADDMISIEVKEDLEGETILINNKDGVWSVSSSAMDSSEISEYVKSIQSLQAKSFAYNIDQLPAIGFWNGKLTDTSLRVATIQDAPNGLVLKFTVNEQSQYIVDSDSLLYKKLLSPLKNWNDK